MPPPMRGPRLPVRPPPLDPAACPGSAPQPEPPLRIAAIASRQAQNASLSSYHETDLTLWPAPEQGHYLVPLASMLLELRVQVPSWR
jgi:hypothetical protein